MGRNVADLILLDSILRSSNISTRGHGALPAPGVPCAADIDEDLSLEGVNIGMPIEYWEGLGVDPAVSSSATAYIGITFCYIDPRCETLRYCARCMLAGNAIMSACKRDLSITLLMSYASIS